MFLSLCSADFAPGGSPCFNYFSRCDWFVASSHDIDENKELDHESTINFPLIVRLFP